MSNNNNEGEWKQCIPRKSKKPTNKAFEGTFKRNRPNDSIVKTKSISFELDDEHEEMIKLENPLFWNQFAFIWNVTKRVQNILLKYQIFPKYPVMELSRCLDTISRNITNYDLYNEFDKLMERLNRTIIFVSVIPRFTEREYGRGEKIYMIHIRFNNYLIADSESVQMNNNFLLGFNEYHGYLGEKCTHIPISDDLQECEDNKKNFINVMKIVKDSEHKI